MTMTLENPYAPHRSSGTPTIQLGDTVRVVNKGDETLYFCWNNRRYELPPETDRFIPIEAAIQHLGDPRAGENVASVRTPEGIVHWLPDRATEIRRMANLVNAGGPSLSAPNYPKVEVYTLEGERLHMVADDPLGERNITAPTTMHEANDTRIRMHNLEQTVDSQNLLIQKLLSQNAKLLEAVGISPEDSESARDDGLPEDDNDSEPTLYADLTTPVVDYEE